MKNKTISFVLCLLCYLCFFSCENKKRSVNDTEAITKDTTLVTETQSTSKLEFLWETDTILKTPESALYDKERQVIYVSNVNFNPRKKDENGFISKIDKTGNIINLEWVKGMSSPKGLGLFKNTLYVTDVNEIISINVETGEIIKKYPVENAGMLNDISIDTDGTVYITDMDTGNILILKDDTISLWKSNLIKPNGIFVETDRVLIAASNSTFTSYNKTTKVPTVICEGISRGDGIEKMNSGSYLVSNWEGELFIIKKETPETLLSTKSQNIQTADIGIIKDENIVLVPTFFKNKLVAYKVIE